MVEEKNVESKKSNSGRIKGKKKITEPTASWIDVKCTLRADRAPCIGVGCPNRENHWCENGCLILKRWQEEFADSGPSKKSNAFARSVSCGRRIAPYGGKHHR